MAQRPVEDNVEQVLAARDLSFARTLAVVLHDVFRMYFRPEIEGMENVPRGPVLFVANHSGGSSTPDSVVFIVELIERFGLDWPLVWMGHDALLRLPVLGPFLRRCGVVPARPGAARAALRAGAAVVVYPGGELELHRPWVARNEIRFEGRTGFVRLAREAGAPIVPVVSSGGQNTYLPISDGRRAAHLLRLDRAFDLKALPLSLAVPWGVNSLLPFLPLPAKLRIRILAPIDVDAEYGDDVQAAYTGIETRMQHALTELVHGHRERTARG